MIVAKSNLPYMVRNLTGRQIHFHGDALGHAHGSNSPRFSDSDESVSRKFQFHLNFISATKYKSKKIHTQHSRLRTGTEEPV